MAAPSTKGKGKTIVFLQSLLDSAPPTCVTWPFCRDGGNGYGRLGWNGKMYWAHRLMCELANGEAPSPDHEATHSCGNGKHGCVNPRHLTWGTRTRNQKDRKFHGTKAPGGHRRPSKRKLTVASVAEIRALKGKKTQREIAAIYGVSDATIRDIYSGKSWRGQPEAWRELTRDEVLEIRSLRGHRTADQIAEMLGVSRNSVWRVQNGRAYTDIA